MRFVERALVLVLPSVADFPQDPPFQSEVLKPQRFHPMVGVRIHPVATTGEKLLRARSPVSRWSRSDAGHYRRRRPAMSH